MRAYGTGQWRLLIVNPNSNPAVTALIKASVLKVLSASCQADVIHIPDSPFAIESRQDRDIAEPLVIAALREHEGYDAYVMACFDDIAVTQARRFIDVPIVDAVTASVNMARKHGSRFAIVTTVQAMVPGIQALLADLGVADACTVLAANIRVAEAAAGGAETLRRLDETIARAKDEFGATAIILGSGGLTGHSDRLTRYHDMPVIDCIEAAVATAEAQSRSPVLSENNSE
jgi:allantoin racemase